MANADDQKPSPAEEKAAREKKRRPVEAVALHEAAIVKGDRVYSDDGRKLEDAENVGASAPDTDADETPPQTRP
jgi:hypothetical protein